MWRNVFYDNSKKKIFLWSWDKDGNRKKFDFDYEPYLYVETNNKKQEEAKSLFGTSLKKMTFARDSDRNNYVKTSGLKRVFYNLRPEQQFLLELYKDKDYDWSGLPFKTFMIDIEVYTRKADGSRGEFPDADEAKYPINVITIYDTLNETFNIWGLGEYDKATLAKSLGEKNGESIDLNKIKYTNCITEQELLEKFLKFWTKDYPDAVSGWNCIEKSQNVWLHDSICKIADVNLDDKLSDTNIIRQKLHTGIKRQYELTSSYGTKIKCSKDHRFPIFLKNKDNYCNKNTITKRFQDASIAEIEGLLQQHDVYVQHSYNTKNRVGLTYRELIIHLYQTGNINFKISDQNIKKVLLKNSDFKKLFKHEEYHQGKDFFRKSKLWNYDTVKNYLTPKEIYNFLSTTNNITIVSDLVSRSFDLENIDTKIPTDVFRFLGYIFTDGSFYRNPPTFSITSKEPELINKYIQLYNTITDKTLSNSTKINYTLGIGYSKNISFSQTIFSLLMPLIFENKTNKKILDISLMSRLSNEQYNDFLLGMIDGDGSISGNGVINICHYDNDVNLDYIMELNQWNNIHSIIGKNNIRFAKTTRNKDFYKYAANNIWHTFRYNNINNYYDSSWVDVSCSSKKIKAFHYIDYDLVKIKTITDCNIDAEMYDIETSTHYFECNGIKTHNCNGFDVPYIINRIGYVLGEEEAKSLSPVNKLYMRQIQNAKFGKDMNKWYIRGITCLDYMELYQTFSRSQQDSYSLNNITTVEEVGGKLDFEGDLDTLADTNWNHFVSYNIHDVNLVKKLDEKLRFISIARFLAYKGFTKIEDSLGKVMIVTGAMCKEANRMGRIIPTFPPTSVQEDYVGGFVLEPQRGLQEAVVSFDANSLYPNTIITLNLSPETKIGKVWSKDDESIEIKFITGKVEKFTHSQFQQFCIKGKIAVSSADVLFRQDFKGICPNFIDALYQERVAIQQQLEVLEKQDPTPEIKTKIQHLDLMQFTIKIFLNSAYGTYANKYSPFYDIDVAASITETGQAVVKEAAQIANQYLKSDDNSKDNVIYQDTDSVYLSINQYLKANNIPLLDNKSISKDCIKVTDKLQVHINDKINEWARNVLYSIDPRFFFKRESICDTALFLEKKRYILSVLHDGKRNKRKIKYIGVEVQRSSYSVAIREMMKEVIATVFDSKDRLVTDAKYREIYEKFKTLDIDQIAFRSSIKDYNKYAKISDGFKVGSGTPIHVKSAIYFNELLKILNLKNHYPAIVSGNKIKYLYTAQNKYGIGSIGFNDKLPPEFGIDIDIEKMFEKIVAPCIERVYSCIGWSIPDMRKQYASDFLDLFGI